MGIPGNALLRGRRTLLFSTAVVAVASCLTATPANAQADPVPLPKSDTALEASQPAQSPLSNVAQPNATEPAQTSVATPDRHATTSGGDADIVVTGSRIVREGYAAPTPLTVIGEERLATNANSNLATFVVAAPVFAGSSSGRSSFNSGAGGAGGVNTLNLRALGANRTLVLLDGFRIAPVHPLGFSDINALPQQLISRVDVVTGGASAVYGSDAVTGVVNFTLDKNFVGFKSEVSGGVTNYGDGLNYRVAASAGVKFADDRGHLLISGEHNFDEGIKAGTRPWNFLGWQNFINPAYTATNGQPQRLILPMSGPSNASYGGLVVSGPLRGTIFGENGTPSRFIYGDIVSDAIMRGGDWRSTDVRRFGGGIAPQESRQNLFGRAAFDVTDALNVYAQVSWTRDKNVFGFSPSFMTGNAGPLIRIDNAFLPEAVRTAMVANNITSIQIGTTNLDLGNHTQYITRRALSYRGGASGKFAALGNDWRWSVAAQKSSSYTDNRDPTNISVANYRLATDAVRDATTGAIVCRSTLTNPTNGCSPWNALGTGVNSANSAGYRFINSPSFVTYTQRQTTLDGTLTGEPFSLWAGPVSVAASVEYRRDSVSGTNDELSRTAGHIFFNPTAVVGSLDVKEAAFETLIPLAKDQSWARNWDLNAAIRLTDYSISGFVTTWKLGTTFEPLSGVRFRATRSRDIRAPALQELFLPQATTITPTFDPFTNTTIQFPRTQTGNLNLKPERGDTLGIGVVVQPAFFRGFSASVDYFDVKISDAISSLTADQVLAACFAGVTEPCGNITRNAAGVLTSIRSGYLNFAAQRAKGLDFETTYTFPLSNVSADFPGTLSLHGNATLYIKNVIDNRLTPAVDRAGENSLVSTPKFNLTGSLDFSTGPFRSLLTLRHISSGVIDATYFECTSGCPVSTSLRPTVNDNHIKGANYLDASIQYDIGLGGRDKATLFFNVRNIGNVSPPKPVFGPLINNGSNSVLYDVDGRVFRGGVRLRF